MDDIKQIFGGNPPIGGDECYTGKCGPENNRTGKCIFDSSALPLGECYCSVAGAAEGDCQEM